MKHIEKPYWNFTNIMICGGASLLLTVADGAWASKNSLVAENSTSVESFCATKLGETKKPAVVNEKAAVEEFTKHFKKTLYKDIQALNISGDDLEDAKIVEVTGNGIVDKLKTDKKIFIASKGHRAWWFVEFKTLGFTRHAAGDLSTLRGSKEFRDLAGSTVVDQKNTVEYEYDEKTKLFVNLSREIKRQFQKFADVLAASGDGTEELLLREYGPAITTQAQKQTLKLDDFGPGRVLKLRSRETSPHFFIYLPNELGKSGYIFMKSDENVPLIERMMFKPNLGDQNSRTYWSYNNLVELGQKTLTDRWFDTYYNFVLNEKTSPLTYYHYARNEPFSFTFVSPEKLSEIKKAVAEKDRENDEFEAGPYTYFAQTELENFMRSGLIHMSFDFLKDIELIGEGYSENDATKKFQVFKYTGFYYYYTRVEGRPVFDRYYFAELADHNNQGHIFVANFKNSQFYKIFGKKIILPSGRRLIIDPDSRQLGPQGISYKLGEAPSRIDSALERLRKTAITNEDEAQDD